MTQYSTYYLTELLIHLKIREVVNTKNLYRVRTNDSAILDTIALFPQLDGNHAQSMSGEEQSAELDDWDFMDVKVLKARLSQAVSGPIRAGMESLIDAELSSYGNSVEEQAKLPASPAAFLQKLNRIVEFRVERLNPRSPVPKREESFRCYVQVIIGGWADNTKRVILYFNYTDSFSHFVSQLQEVTRNCVVPLLNVETSKHASNHNDPESQDPIFRDRAPNEKGYTLLDGPWTYRLPVLTPGSKSGSVSYKVRRPIAWEDQYNRMKSEIFEIAEEVRNGKWKEGFKAHVILTHSMDVLVEKMHHAQLVLDQEGEKEFQAMFKQLLIDNPGVLKPEDAGERYTDMMKRVYDEEQRALRLGESKGFTSTDQNMLQVGKDSETSSNSPLSRNSSSQGRGEMPASSPGVGNASATSQGNSPSDNTTEGNTPA